MYSENKIGSALIAPKEENLSNKINDIYLILTQIENNLKYPVPENCQDTPQPADKLIGLGMRLNSIAGRLEEIVKITSYIG